uniref:lysylphosphatidylglycerol synthase transmembrane domain-containing protein n=1 Tax=Halomonas sp. TaxID=1486246 RepID=UPI002608CFA5|nr:lysylphosphatidylglycerol synthase transmembrane domain-containing protein [Halomonas sp.]
MAESLAIFPRSAHRYYLHGTLLTLALLVTLIVPWWLGGQGTFLAIAAFPLPIFALMTVLAVVCWNINAARLRLMLAGRAGRLGQAGALSIEMASKFAICATPGGAGGPPTFLALLTRRGYSPSQGAAIYLVDQSCDMLFFTLMLSIIVTMTLTTATDWPYQALVESALLGLIMTILLLCLSLYFLPRLLRARPLSVPLLGHRHWFKASRRRWLARRLLRCRRAAIMTLQLPPAKLVAIFALCSLHWVLRYSLLFLAVVGVSSITANSDNALGGMSDGMATWAWCFLTQMLSMATGQFSMLPGGAGAAEVSVGALLLPLMDREQAAAAVVVWRLVSYHLYLLAGAPFFMTHALRWLKGRKVRSKLTAN